MTGTKTNTNTNKTILNFAKTSDNFLSDLTVTVEAIRLMNVANKIKRDAQLAYVGSRKNADGTTNADYSNYMNPYAADFKAAKAKAETYATRLIAFYGKSRNTLHLEDNEAVIDLEALFQNIGALNGPLSDIKKDKQLTAIKGLMDSITGRQSVSCTRMDKKNSVLSFGRVKVVKDNVCDTILALEVGLSLYTCIKSVYITDNTPYIDGDKVTVRALAERRVINTIKNPLS